jgi:predicted phosphoribosyltransferase
MNLNTSSRTTRARSASRVVSRLARIAREVEHQRKEIGRRLDVFRKDRAPLDLKNRTVVIVDDGIATGNTMIAAVEAIRDQGAEEVVIATPVIPKELVRTIELVAPLVFLDSPGDFEAVGQYYEEFEMTSQDSVRELMLLANTA